ncbi:hypothetical protein Q3G72_001050 [Acer saccharum]|nr:hypothetical protein Q3G72_001050 [Acer saccharum]
MSKLAPPKWTDPPLELDEDNVSSKAGGGGSSSKTIEGETPPPFQYFMEEKLASSAEVVVAECWSSSSLDGRWWPQSRLELGQP